MKTIFGAAILLLFASMSFAQTATDDYPKNEFFAGYSFLRSEQEIQNGFQTSHNGFEVSVVRNLNRYFGIKGDFSAAFGNRTSTVVETKTGTEYTVRGKNQIYNFLAGVQVKDNRAQSRFKPFAHALVGVGYGRFKSRVENCPAATRCNVFPENNSTGFAAVIGGGLDIKINNKIDFRLIQIDYNPIRLRGGFQNNVRFGVGIVFH